MLVCRVELNTQKPPTDLSSEEAQQAQQLREDAVIFFRGFGGLRSKIFLLLVRVQPIWPAHIPASHVTEFSCAWQVLFPELGASPSLQGTMLACQLGQPPSFVCSRKVQSGQCISIGLLRCPALRQSCPPGPCSWLQLLLGLSSGPCSR